MGATHIRSAEDTQYADDNGSGRNFRLELDGGKCYVLLAEGFSDDVSYRSWLLVVRYGFNTTVLEGGPWATFPTPR